MKKTTLSLMSILTLSHLAYAGGDIVAIEEPLVEVPIVAEDSSWEFRLSPYAWFAGLEGDIASIPGLPAMPIDISSSDALEDTEASLMLIFEAKKNGKGFFMDVFYSDVQSEETLIEVNDRRLVLNSTTKTTMVSGAYLHEVYSEEQSVIDLFAGVRYWNIDSHLSLSGGLGILPPGDHEESWVDPLIGIKGRITLSDTKFYVSGGAAIGGFGVGSDLFYDLNANFGYQWNESIGTMVGYRLYDLDYEDDGFVYDITQQGWIFGLTWAF
jgi:hypothetical protein